MDFRDNYFGDPTISTFYDKDTKPWRNDMSYRRSSPPKQITTSAAENVDQREPIIHDIPSISQSTSSLSLSVTEFERSASNQHNRQGNDDRIMQGAAILKSQLQKQQEELIEQEARYMASPESTPGRSRHYSNSAYFSDTEDEDDDYGTCGIEKTTPSHFPFPDVDDAGNWAEFTQNDFKTPQRQFSSNDSRASESRGSKLSASPDAYIDQPPKRTMDWKDKQLPEKSLNDFIPIEPRTKSAYEEVGASAFAGVMLGTPMGAATLPRNKSTTSSSSPPRTNSSATYTPLSPPKVYPLNRIQSAISVAESDALDFLASQFSTEGDKLVEPVAPMRKKSALSSKQERAETKRQMDKQQQQQSTRKALLFSLVQKPKNMAGDPFKSVVSPFSKEYRLLQKDQGYLHAVKAGTLWQSLVSQHVKFPSSWFNGQRSPSMGLGERRLWQYVGRHRVGGDQALNRVVYNRGAAGRILIHLVVKEEDTLAPALDVVIGCFHPNARGVRTTAEFEPILEDCRDIWLATRRRFRDDLEVENSLRYHEDDKGNATLGDSPLGPKHAVTNGNMRSIFGYKPPLQTIFVLESEMKKVLSDQYANQDMPPSLVLLQCFLKVR